MEKFNEILGVIWNALKRAGAVLADICRRAWKIIKRYAPKIWAAIKRFCIVAWTKIKELTAKLLDVDVNLNKRAVYVCLTCFLAIIVLFIIAVA